MTNTPCSLPDCQNPAKARGWCNTHYQRWYAHDDPLWVNPKPEDRAGRLLYHSESRPNGCREWIGALNNGGYGCFRSTTAHRAAYETWIGPIPHGHVVRHKCDNRKCIEPTHLESGTTADNNRDTMTRGRDRSVGTRNYNAKLDDDKVRQIRLAYATGEGGYKKLSRRFGVSPSTIQQVVNGTAWRHVQ